jgi:hypothetical protein
MMKGFLLGVSAMLFTGWWFMSPPAAPALFESSCRGAGGAYTDPTKFESKEHFLAPMITARW